MASVFGNIDNPLTKISGSGYGDLQSGGMINFISNVVKTLIISAGIYAFLNLILAGFQYITSNGNAEQTTQAWQKIYLSLIGLAIMVAAFALSAIIGQILFNDPAAILNPKIYGPGH